MSIVRRKQPAIPNVPNNVPNDMRQFLEAVRTSIQTFQGGRNPSAELDRAVTLGDLKDGRVQLNQGNVFDALTGNGKKGSDGSQHGKAPKKIPNLFNAPVDPPTKAEQFEVQVTPSGTILTWAQTKYRGHGFTEIFRQRTLLSPAGEPVDPPSFNAAQHIHAHTVGTIYADTTEPSVGYYYWIRHVNSKGDVGPISSDDGVFVKTPATIKEQMSREGVTPVTTVATMPSNYVADLIYVADIKQMMNWDGSKYTFDLPDGVITGEKIAANTIGGDKILANTIGSEHLQAGSVTADTVNVDKLSAFSSNLGDITGGSLNINGRFIVRTDGTAELRSSTQNIGLVLDNDRLAVYDESGRLRVEIGLLSY